MTSGAFGRAPVEAVVVFVNHDNPVSVLTLAQLREIYLGKIDNWKQVGGLDKRIQLYSTESAIGGSLFFSEIVLNGEDFETTMRGYTNSHDMLQAVGHDGKDWFWPVDGFLRHQTLTNRPSRASVSR